MNFPCIVKQIDWDESNKSNSWQFLYILSFQYTDWDLSGPKCKCRKSKKYSFSGVGGKGSWCSFDNSYRLINTKTEGRKTYMQYYQYSYCEELDHTFRTYWTTVYDKVTGSHLPYEKYFHYTDNYSGWDSYNITYIPTQFDWINLPDDCQIYQVLLLGFVVNSLED